MLTITIRMKDNSIGSLMVQFQSELSDDFHYNKMTMITIRTKGEAYDYNKNEREEYRKTYHAILFKTTNK